MFERTIECARAARLIGLIVLVMAPTCSVAAQPVSTVSPALPGVQTHGNTQRAGLLKNGTLWLNLRAARGLWRPEKETGPALEIEAFGETGGSLMAPSPLIRVPEGTEIVAKVKNELEFAMRMHGLCEHNGEVCAPTEVPAGATRELH